MIAERKTCAGLTLAAMTLAAMTTLVCFAAAPALADSITMTPRAIQVGKWAEGIAFDGTSVWVAESGQQSIAQVDPGRGTVSRHVTVGRLPVGMTAYKDGAVYALVQTSKLVWQQFPKQSNGKSFSGLDGCPGAFAASDKALWILTWPDCSSDNGRLIRLDPATNARASSGLLGDMTEAIVAAQGKVFVAHSRGTNLSIVDEQSLAMQQANIQGAALHALGANSTGVFAGGELGNQGLVVSIDPRSGQELQRQVVDERINQVVADNESVVAIGSKSKIYVFAAATLQPQRTITLPTKPYGPTAVQIINGDLYISNGQQFGENGALLILNSWRPAAAAAPVTPAPIPTTPPTAVVNCPYQVTNTGDATGIWMYQDPDTSAPQVESIPADSKGLVIDQCLAGWCHASFRGKSGWVASSHIKAVCN